MQDSRKRELAVETLNRLGVQKVTTKEVLLLLSAFCSVADHERQRCINHVRYCEQRLSEQSLKYDPALAVEIVAESLEVDLA